MRKTKLSRFSTVIILIILVFATLWLFEAAKQIEQVKTESVDLRRTLSELQSSNAALREQIANTSDSKVRENIARQRLGLILPGEIVYKES
jgi:cell division protein FtsB